MKGKNAFDSESVLRGRIQRERVLSRINERGPDQHHSWSVLSHGAWGWLLLWAVQSP